MTLIQRHMLRQLLVLAGSAALTLAFIGVLVRSLMLFELLTQRVLSLGDFFMSLLTSTPMVFYLSGSLAAPVAIIYLYQQWSRENQIVSLRTAGLTDRHIAMPGVVAGVAMMVFTASMSLYLVPVAIRTFTDIQYEAATQLSLGLLEDGYPQRLEPKLSLAFRTRAGANLVQGVTILDGRKEDAFRYIYADRGHIMLASGGEGESGLVLEKGTYVVRDARKEALTPIDFDELLIPLGELDKVAKRNWRGFFEEHIGALLHPSPEVVAQGDAGKWMAEGHKRIVTPLLAVSYALFALGALLRGAYGRSRAGMIYATFVSFCIGGWHILLTVTPSLVARRPELVAGYYALAALPALLGLAMLYLPPRIVQRRIFGRHAPG